MRLKEVKRSCPKLHTLIQGPIAAAFLPLAFPEPSDSSWVCFFFFSDLPDLPPALVPAPPKRARPSPGQPLAEHEDPEERLNRDDQHITAVLTKIIVRLNLAEGDKAS